MTKETMGYTDLNGNVILDSDLESIDTGTSNLNENSNTGSDLFSQLEQDIRNQELELLSNFKRKDLDRAAELKQKELYRKTGKPLQYNFDGTLETDSNAEIRAKEVANTAIRGADWLLEATENIVDVGQGDWLDNARIDAVIGGKDYNMSNKDIIAARNTTLEKLVQEYNDAKYDPNADKAIYTLRKFDGYDELGNPKYLYKHGLAEVSAADRYRNQWVEDGFEIVDEKRFAGAEKWENTLHALQESLKNRALDYGMVKDANGRWTTTDKASGVNFGSGYTELYNKNLLGIPDPTDEEFARNKFISEELMNQRDKTRISNSNFIDAIQSGAMKLGIGGLDTILDIVTPGNNKLLDKYNNQEWIDKKVGYDRTEATQTLVESMHDLKNGNYMDGIIKALSNPDVAAESLPMMIAMFLPLPGSRVAGAARALKIIEKAKALGKPLDTIKKLEVALFRKGHEIGISDDAFKLYLKYRDAPNFLKTADMLRRNAGFLGVDMSLTNDIINERIQNKIAAGEEPEVGLDEVLSIFGTNTALLLLDKLAFKDVIGIGAAKSPGRNVLKKYLNDSFSFADTDGKKEILRTIFNKASHVAQSMGEEAGQEYLQTWGEILGAKVGVDGQTVSDVLSDSDSQDEALMGLIGGLGAGGQIAGLSSGLGLGSALTKRSIDWATMDKARKSMRKANKINDIVDNQEGIANADLEDVLVNEIMTDGANLKDFSIKNSKDISTLVNKMIDSFGGNLDDNAKQILQKEFIKNIFLKAIQYSKNEAANGNKEPMRNTLTAIKNVSNDDDINFSFKDVTKDRTNDIAEAFSNIIADDGKADIKDFDNVRYQSDADYRQAIDQAIIEKKAEKIQQIINDIDVAKQEAIVSRQGAMLDFGDGQPGSEIDDDLFASESDIQTLDMLKELILKYRNNGFVKDYEDVMDEIKKFGFIEEYVNNGQKKIKIKPSMNKYDRELYKQFINPDQIGNVLSESASQSQGATLPNFVNWSESRWKKFMPTQSGKNKQSRPSRKTANYMYGIEEENEWFKQKAKDLRSLLNMHTVGEDGFTQARKDEVEASLKTVESNIEMAEKLIKLHRTRIEDFVKNELGLDGLDLNDPKHRKILNGIFTNMEGTELSQDSFGDMELWTIIGKNGKKYNGKNALSYKIHQLQQEGLKPNKNFGKDVNMIVNGEPETISGYASKTSKPENINNAFEKLYGMYNFQKSLLNVYKEKGLTQKQRTALVNVKNSIKNIRKYLKNNGFNDKNINDVLKSMHDQRTKTDSTTGSEDVSTNKPTGKKYQKSKDDETYAESKGIMLDYKNESGDNPETTFEKQTTIEQFKDINKPKSDTESDVDTEPDVKVEPDIESESKNIVNENTTVLELDNIISEIINSQIDITNEQINNFINSVKEVISNVSDIDKKELAGKVGTVVSNISSSIDKDINVLHELQDELNNTKKEKIDNEKSMANEYDKANAAGSLSGIIDKIKNTIGSIKRKIIKLGKKAFGLITDIENKKKLRDSLKKVQMHLSDNGESSNIISELNDLQDIYNNTNTLRSVFSRISKKAKDKAASLFGTTLKATKDEYPEVYKLYEKINSKLRRFKRKDGPYTYGDNKISYGEILADQYRKEKYEYEQGSNKHENFQDFMSFKEWITRRGNKDDMKKYADMSEEDIINYEKQMYDYGEQSGEQDKEQNNNIEIDPMDYLYGFDAGFAEDNNIESVETDYMQKRKAEKQVEEGYNNIIDKNKKIQNNEDC